MKEIDAQPQELPTLSGLVTNAERKYNEGGIYINEYGYEEFYTYWDAARDSVAESSATPSELFNSLLPQTRITPKDFDMALVESVETWDELFTELSGIIIRHELALANPDLVEDSNTKFDEVENRRNL